MRCRSTASRVLVFLLVLLPLMGSPALSAADPLAHTYEIEVAGTRYPVHASLRPMYDPDNRRIRC